MVVYSPEIPRWLRFEKGVNEGAKVYFLDLRGQNIDLGQPGVKEKINRYLKAMLHSLDIGELRNPGLIKCHIGEPKGITWMIPDFALSSIEFLKEKGVERIVSGDSTTLYSGARGYKENPAVVTRLASLGVIYLMQVIGVVE